MTLALFFLLLLLTGCLHESLLVWLVLCVARSCIRILHQLSTQLLELHLTVLRVLVSAVNTGLLPAAPPSSKRYPDIDFSNHLRPNLHLSSYILHYFEDHHLECSRSWSSVPLRCLTIGLTAVQCCSVEEATCM